MTVQELNEGMLKRLWNKVRLLDYQDDLEGRYFYNGKEKAGLPQNVVKVLKADKGND